MDEFETAAAQRLLSFITRIEGIEEERKELGEAKSEVFAEAKGDGFDTKVMRKLIALRKQDPNERAEQEAILETYCRALGMNRQSSLFDGAPVEAAKPRRTAEETEANLYARAVEVVRASRRASVNMIKNTLRVPYRQAATLIERMEHDGVVSSPDSEGCRRIINHAREPEDAADEKLREERAKGVVYS